MMQRCCPCNSRAGTSKSPSGCDIEAHSMFHQPLWSINKVMSESHQIMTVVDRLQTWKGVKALILFCPLPRRPPPIIVKIDSNASKIAMGFLMLPVQVDAHSPGVSPEGHSDMPVLFQAIRQSRRVTRCDLGANTQRVHLCARAA